MSTKKKSAKKTPKLAKPTNPKVVPTPDPLPKLTQEMVTEWLDDAAAAAADMVIKRATAVYGTVKAGDIDISDLCSQLLNHSEVGEQIARDLELPLEDDESEDSDDDDYDEDPVPTDCGGEDEDSDESGE